MEAFFKKGQRVLFQGDSVTDCGRDWNDGGSLGEGYPQKIAGIYGALFGADVRFINRGVSGNRVKDVLARYQEDILAVKPDFLSILIGINDVWRRYDSGDPTSVEAFEACYRELLAAVKKDLPETKIMIMEPFVLHSLPDRAEWHEDLDPKLQAVRHLAVEFADYFIPLDGVMAKAAGKYGCEALAQDGVHPTALGHGVIACEYLKTLGII